MIRNPSHRTQNRDRAFTLLEALMLVTILGITGIATGRALVAMMHTPTENDNEFITETALVDKMEYLRALPYASLASEAGKSQSVFTDNVIVDNRVASRAVTISYVVPATGAISGVPTRMLQLTVTMGPRTVVTRVTEP